jgi:NAD(P)-dependent dehydrogenase (short-subunit alcohol dehydrogenase family)
MTTPFLTDLDTPLLNLNGKDKFTVRDSFNGLHAFGAIGSGKTSGVGKAIAGAFLRAGYGGLVCVAKPEETELWKNYCKEHGREADMIIFDTSRHFNFLSYEFARKGADAANSATDTLMKVLKAADLAAGQGQGKEGEAFWIKTTREMILNTITVLYSAIGTVRVESIVEFITSMPTAPPSSEEARSKLVNNYALDRLTRCRDKPVYKLPPHSLKRVRNYFFKQFVAMPDKTRGSIVTSVTAELNRFSDGILRECFTTTTDLVPEMVFNGHIIIMGFPSLSYQEEGTVAQGLFKLMFQRAIEARNGLGKQFQERPTFLYADEAQYFVSHYDDTFLSTCRGSKCAVVFMTQSLPTYFAQLGKDKSDAVDGFVGKFGNKVFHLNSCPRTNKYASDLIGKGLKLHKNQSRTITSSRQTNRGATQTATNQGSNQSEGSNETNGAQEHLDYFLEPNFFATSLRTGAPKNKYLVTGVWFSAGAQFQEPIPDTTSNVVLATFSQR